MQSYVNVLTNYNIIFIEEIRDSSETAFPTLCSMLKDYEYKRASDWHQIMLHRERISILHTRQSDE